jgi:hypothetical protein
MAALNIGSAEAIRTIPNQLDSDIAIIQAGAKADETTHEP